MEENRYFLPTMVIVNCGGRDVHIYYAGIISSKKEKLGRFDIYYYMLPGGKSKAFPFLLKTTERIYCSSPDILDGKKYGYKLGDEVKLRGYIVNHKNKMTIGKSELNYKIQI